MRRLLKEWLDKEGIFILEEIGENKVVDEKEFVSILKSKSFIIEKYNAR